MAFTNEEVMRMTEIALKQFHVVSGGTESVGTSVVITEIESTATQLSVKYEDSTEFIIFNRIIDDTTGIITFFCVSNGATVVLTPTTESIYIQEGV